MMTPNIKVVLNRQRRLRRNAKHQNQDSHIPSPSKKRSASSRNVDCDDSCPLKKRRAVPNSEVPNFAAMKNKTKGSYIDRGGSDSKSPLFMRPPRNSRTNHRLHPPHTSIVYVADSSPVNLRFREPDGSDMEDLPEPMDQMTGLTNIGTCNSTERMAAAVECFANSGTLLEIIVNKFVETVNQMSSGADRMAATPERLAVSCDNNVWHFREVPGATEEDVGIRTSGQESDNDNSSYSSERTV